MICSLIKSLHREEKEVNYKVLPNLLIEKTTPRMDSFVHSELVPLVLHTGVIFLMFYYCLHQLRMEEIIRSTQMLKLLPEQAPCDITCYYLFM